MNYHKLLQFISEGSEVVRFHSRPGLRPQTDGQHSYGVAMLCYLMTEGKASSKLLMAALTHDLAEQASSDISAPAKRSLNLRERLAQYEDNVLCSFGLSFDLCLTEEEQAILKTADQYEGMMYCIRERNLGNRNVELIFNRWSKWIEEYPPINNAAAQMLEAIVDLWNDALCGHAPSFDVFAHIGEEGKV